MSRILTYCFVLVVLLHFSAKAQLSVDASYSPQQLVEDVLIGGGVQISNVQFTGNGQSRGYFEANSSNFDLAEGVILSTGRIQDAVGPNNGMSPQDDEGVDFDGAGDAQLTAISAVSTFDASILEFDFIPLSDTVQFKYVFASNEYGFWEGQGFTDVFAFLISGPGIVGEENIALIPNTTIPVTIDDLNSTSNAQFYVDNENPPGQAIEYNGYTTVLTAIGELVACETYHIRLAIADGGVGDYDSAVFLEARSFSSPVITLNAESSFSSQTGDQNYVEGCSSVELNFERSGDLASDLSVDLILSGTAENGSDISNIPTTITFSAGSAVAAITFDVLDDGVAEGNETMTITLDQPSTCLSVPVPSVTFTIEDKEPMAVSITPEPPPLTCPEEFNITVSPTGGYPDYTFNWAGLAESGPSITVFPLETSSYFVTVTDACGQSETVSTMVTIPNYTPLEVTVEDVTVCNGDDAILDAVASGGLGAISYSWDTGGSSPNITFTPTASTAVTVTVTDDCNLSESATANVGVDEVDASFTHRLIAHATVQFTSEAYNISDFSWDFGDGLGSTRPNPRHTYDEEGDYIVTLSLVNANGCIAILEDTVTVYPPLRVYVPNAFTPNADGINDVFGMVGEGYLHYDLEIYDRWGNRMRFGRFRDATAWDGTYKGSPVPADVYTYKILVQPPVGIEFREAGVIHVLSTK